MKNSPEAFAREWESSPFIKRVEIYAALVVFWGLAALLTADFAYVDFVKLPEIREAIYGKPGAKVGAPNLENHAHN